jgi:4-amino-4-deoxy-L-arabinose transferase-like glycosyltransferase
MTTANPHPGFARVAAGALLLAAFVCLTYAAAGCAVLALLRAFVAPSVPPVTLKLAVFTVAALAALAAGWPLWRALRNPPDAEAHPVPGGAHAFVGLFAVLLAVAAVVAPNLEVYPWAAPDETHHLNVARNLAEHGRYASGLPDEGFSDFDSYDSVGLPVIGPVAAVMAGLSSSISHARLVMAFYMLLFVCAVYALFVNTFGHYPALVAALAAGLGHGSIYLGRTLYGEAPALAWFCVGLLCWRAALHRSWHVWGLLAGLCFGLACLTKTILLLSAFCFLGALAFDMVGPRRIRLPHLVLPAVGTLLPLGAWSAVKSIAGTTVTANTGDTLGIYQFYLLPGLGAALNNLGHAGAHPAMHLAFALGIAAVLPIIFHRRYDPPLVVLFLVGALYAWWWLAFTPGQHTRYLWFSQAIAGAFTGALAGRLAVWAWREHRPMNRALAALAAVAILAPWAPWVAQQAREVYTNREMQQDHDLAAFIDALPPGTRIATVEAPVRGTLIFLVERSAKLYEPGDPAAANADVLITWDEARIPEEARASRIERIGRHVVAFLVNRSDQSDLGPTEGDIRRTPR